jgi:hypothetical protein
VLCSGAADGTVVLSAFGLFQIGGADLAAAGLLASPSKEQFAVQHASVSPDLSRVLVAFASPAGAYTRPPFSST